MKLLYYFLIKKLLRIKLFLITFFISIQCLYADEIQTKNSFLSANSIIYHDEISLISALGDVEVVNGTEILRADKVTYDINSDHILAIGNVSLNDKNNNIFFSDSMELQGNLKKGVIKNFSSILSDGATLSASLIIRDDENGDELKKITYTRCKPCEDNMQEAPIWQLRALKSKRNIKDGVISYENALLDIYGLPVLYLPYISHADPSIKTSSGLLSPKITSNTIFGFSYSQPYYLALSTSKDLTITPTMTSNEGPIIESHYRSLRSKGSSDIKASFTRGSHTNIDGKESNKFRGHLDFKISERINKNWVIGINAVRASDFSYLNRYKMGHTNDSNLTQRAYISGRKKDFYTEIESMYFQPLNAFKSNRDVPLILPNIKMIWYKNYTNGATRKISLNGSIIAKANASNVQKLSLETMWSKNKITNSGHIFKASLSTRVDNYRNKKTDNAKVIGKLGTHNNYRIIPKIETTWSFPLITYFYNKTALIEPIIHGIIAPKGGNPDSIHNLDSIDFELSDSNLFSSNRFAGLDRVEEGSRINFGIKSTLVLKDYGEFKSIVGRSWSPLNPQVEYISGTGLNKKLSNIVGNLIYDSKKFISLGYHFRRDALNFRSQRDTLTFNLNANKVTANINYTMVRDDPVPTQSILSEQASVSLSLQINDNWRTAISQNRDLRNSNWGNALNSYGHIEFKNECIIIRLQAERKHQNLIDVPDTNEYSLSVNLVGF